MYAHKSYLAGVNADCVRVAEAKYTNTPFWTFRIASYGSRTVPLVSRFQLASVLSFSAEEVFALQMRWDSSHNDDLFRGQKQSFMKSLSAHLRVPGTVVIGRIGQATVYAATAVRG
jgi:hypothetical protein